MQNQPQSTPRTDAVTSKAFERPTFEAVVSADFARTLERENTRLQAALIEADSAIRAYVEAKEPQPQLRHNLVIAGVSVRAALSGVA